MKQISISEKLFKEIAKAVGISVNPDNFELINLPNIQFIKEEEKMPTQETLTKSETIALFKKHMPDAAGAESFINFYIATGMLKVKEELPGLPIGFTFPFSKREEWTNCYNEMFKQGFEINKK